MLLKLPEFTTQVFDSGQQIIDPLHKIHVILLIEAYLFLTFFLLCINVCMGCRVGVVFSGRQSPGGHNVIWGLYDAVKAHNSNSKVIGFLGKQIGLLKVKIMI
jgi:hypothetical protein